MMGSHRESVLVVRKAIELHGKHPTRSAQSVLDEAMKLSGGFVDLEWESTDPKNPDHVHPDYDSEDMPPAPFAEILRQAFAPDLDVRRLVFYDAREHDDYATSQLVADSFNIWTQRVTMPFCKRYGLDGSKFHPCTNIVDKPDGYVELKLDKEVWVARFAGHLMVWADRNLEDVRAIAEQSYFKSHDSDPDEVAHTLLDNEQLARYEYYSTPAKPGQQC